MVDTQVDIAVRVLFFNVFRLTHDAQEIWHSGRLVSVTSTTDRDGTRLQVSGNAVADGFRIVGENGPILAAAELLTTNALSDSRIVHEQRLIDVQYGGEIGLVARPSGEEQVATPQGQVRASRYRMITPHYAGSVFYDEDQRWVKALIEMRDRPSNMPRDIGGSRESGAGRARWLWHAVSRLWPSPGWDARRCRGGRTW